MALKGTATIELTNTTTGEITTTVEQNLVTDFYKDYFKGIGKYQWGFKNANAYYDANGAVAGSLNSAAYNNMTILEQLFGGIYIFSEEVVEPELPPSSHILASSCVGRQTSGEARFGSYNSIESGPQGDGSHKFVYDFSNTQSNGEIKSISLTNALLGAVGFSAKEEGDFPVSISYSTSISDTVTALQFPGILRYRDLEFRYRFYGGNEKYLVWGQDVFLYTNFDKLYLIRRNGYGEQGSVFDKQYPAYPVSQEAFEEVYIPEFTPYINVSGNGCISNGLFLKDNYLIGFYNLSSDVNDNIKILKINLDDMSYTITDGFQKQYNISSINQITDDIVYLWSNTPDHRRIYIISTGQIFHTTVIETGHCSLYSKNWAIGGIVNTAYDISNPADIKKIPILKTIISAFTGAQNGLKPSLGAILSLDYSQQRAIFIDQLRLNLSTINNLDTPVTKTPELTMKITYTLFDDPTP